MGHYISSRAPLFWILAPLICGFTLGFSFDGPSRLGLLLGALASSLLALLLLGAGRDLARVPWAIAFLAGATLFGWIYVTERIEKPDPNWRELPPREANLYLEVERRFGVSDRYGRATGIGAVRHAPEHLLDLLDHRFYFRLTPAADTSEVTRTQVLRVRGVLEYIKEDPEPDPFDEYLIQSGVFFRLGRGRIIEEVQRPSRLARFNEREANRLERILRYGSSEAEELKNVYVAMLLGKKAALTKERKQAYVKSGTMHFFAISGLHVGIIAFTLHYLIVIVLRCPKRSGDALVLVVLLAYVAVTGSSPSAVRAFLAVAIYLGARVVDRQGVPMSALLLSAVAVLLFDPNQLRHPGFQLSYAVVGSILLYGVPLIDLLKAQFTPFRGLPSSDICWHHRLRLSVFNHVVGLFGISLAATVVSSTLTIHYFGIFTPCAVFLNILIVPIAFLVIISGALSLVFGLFKLVWISGFLNHGAWVLIWTVERIIDASITIPGFYWFLDFASRAAGPVTVVLILFSLLVLQRGFSNRKISAFLLPPTILLLAIFFFASESAMLADSSNAS